MRPDSISFPAIFIPLFALLATVGIGMTSWGESFSTLPGYSREEHIAHVALSGFQKPKVEMGVAEGEKGVWVRMTVTGEVEEGTKGAKGTDVAIAVPAFWKLEEVRGVHVRDIETRDKRPETREFVIPHSLLPTPYSLEFLFTTGEPLDSLHLAHDSKSPALLKLTRLQYPNGQPEQILQFVKDDVVIAL